MHWTKIKTKHYINSGLTFSQRGYHATFCALVAHLEKYPNDRQLSETFGKNYREILDKFPIIFGNSADNIGLKVLEDVERVSQEKSISRVSSRKHRVKSDGHGDGHVTEQRREEDMRVNKKHNYIEQFDLFYSKYPKKIGKQKAIQAWGKLDLKDGLLEKILKSLEAQKESKQWQKDDGEFIPHPATWLNQERWNDEGVENEESFGERIKRLAGKSD